MPSYRQRGTVLTDHTFSVPLDHDRPGGERIEVFAREVVAADRDASGLPWLLFLQGGPGFGGPRLPGRSGWLGRGRTSSGCCCWTSAGPGGRPRRPGTPWPALTAATAR